MLSKKEEKVLNDTGRRNLLRVRIRSLKASLAKSSQHAELLDECLEIKKEIRACEKELELLQ